MHKKNKTFLTREHRTQNTRGGVVVTPPYPNQPTRPEAQEKAPWSTKGQTLKEKLTVYYSNATPCGIRCTAGLSNYTGAAANYGTANKYIKPWTHSYKTALHPGAQSSISAT